MTRLLSRPKCQRAMIRLRRPNAPGNIYWDNLTHIHHLDALYIMYGAVNLIFIPSNAFDLKWMIGGRYDGLDLQPITLIKKKVRFTFSNVSNKSD